MRKYIVGGLVGAALMLSFNVSAAVESFIGKSIDNEYVVKLDGKELDNKALAVEGSSYAPVRVIAESLGLNVDFQNNEVLLSQVPKGVTETVYTDPLKKELTPEQKAKKIQGIDSQIKSKQFNIELNATNINEFKKTNPDDAKIKLLEGSIQKEKDEIAELEAQKVELQK